MIKISSLIAYLLDIIMKLPSFLAYLPGIIKAPSLLAYLPDIMIKILSLLA